MREDELTIYRTSENYGIKVDYDYFYQQSRLHTNWANPVADIGNKVFFLNQFRCRLPYTITGELLPVLERVSPLFAQVQNIEIHDLNEGEEIYPIITGIFDTLRNHVNRFRETATGKFMHRTIRMNLEIQQHFAKDHLVLHLLMIGQIVKVIPVQLDNDHSALPQHMTGTIIKATVGQ
jgi:hypothetical protein